MYDDVLYALWTIPFGLCRATYTTIIPIGILDIDLDFDYTNPLRLPRCLSFAIVVWSMESGRIHLSFAKPHSNQQSMCVKCVNQSN